MSTTSISILFCVLVWVIGGLLFLIFDERKPAAKVSIMSWWAFLMGMAASLLVIGAHLVKL